MKFGIYSNILHCFALDAYKEQQSETEKMSKHTFQREMRCNQNFHVIMNARIQSN